MIQKSLMVHFWIELYHKANSIVLYKSLSMDSLAAIPSLSAVGLCRTANHTPRPLFLSLSLSLPPSPFPNPLCPPSHRPPDCTILVIHSQLPPRILVFDMSDSVRFQDWRRDDQAIKDEEDIHGKHLRDFKSMFTACCLPFKNAHGTRPLACCHS